MTNPEKKIEETAKSSEVSVLNSMTAAELFTPTGTELLFKEIEEKLKHFVADISTPAGRQEIASFAHKISKMKVVLENMGKELTVEQKRAIAAVDAEKKKVKEKMEFYRDEISRPLDEWKEIEKLRVKTREDRLQLMSDCQSFIGEVTLGDVTTRIEKIKELYEFDWQEFHQRATLLKESVTPILDGKYVAVKKTEEERIELENLRKEKEARDKKDHEDKIAKDAADKAKKDAEIEAEKKRVAEEQRVAKERQDLIDKTNKEKKDAEDKALADKKKIQDDADEKVRLAKEASDKAIKDAKDKADKEEKDRKDRLEKERKDKEIAEAAEKKRQADKNHIISVNNGAVRAMVDNGIDEAISRSIVDLVVNNQIPGMMIRY